MLVVDDQVVAQVTYFDYIRAYPNYPAIPL
jgi:hypothetical protein